MGIFAGIALVGIIAIWGFIFHKWVRRELRLQAFFVWTLLWAMGALAILLPAYPAVIATRLGIGRGADLIIYSSIIILLAIAFSLYSHVRNVDRQITRLIREMALRDHE